MARTELPSSVDGLRKMVLQQQSVIADQGSQLDQKQSTIEEQAELITFYRGWKRLIDSQRFGSGSEKLEPDQAQLFNEAETLVASEADDEPGEIAVPAHTRKKRGRRPLPDFFRSRRSFTIYPTKRRSALTTRVTSWSRSVVRVPTN